MTENEILAQLQGVVMETLDLEDLTLTMSSQAGDILGWDSVAHVQIMVAVEAAFGIRFRTADMTGMQNVGELVERVVQRLDSGK